MKGGTGVTRRRRVKGERLVLVSEVTHLSKERKRKTQLSHRIPQVSSVHYRSRRLSLFGNDTDYHRPKVD